MSKSLATELMERRAALITEARAIAQRGVDAKRDLTVDEQDRFDRAVADAEQLEQRAKEIREGEHKAHELEESFRSVTGKDPRTGQRRSLLHVPPGIIAEVHDAVRARRAYSWVAGRETEEQRAALTTSLYGTATDWHGAAPDAPLLLHEIGGAQVEQLSGLKMSFPAWTLPTAQGSVAETVSLGEYDDAAEVVVTAARFGRWSDVSQEASLNGLNSILRMQSMGVARDLNAALVNALETTAGAPVIFATGAEFMVKRSISVIADRTASDPTSLVVVVHPNDAPLLADTTPTDGEDVASTIERFSGARLFASSAMTEGAALIANLRVGVIYGESEAVRVETERDAKTGVETLATSVIAGYGVQVAEAVQAVDLAA